METSQPSRVRVKILDEEFTVVGDAPEETIREIANIVDTRMKELKESYPNSPFGRLAVLCALNLADELHQTSNQMIHPAIEEKTKKILTLLEEGIIGDIYP